MKRAFSLHRLLSQWLRLPLAGPFFKLYAPRRSWKQDANEARPLRVLVVNLMPSLGDTICYLPLLDVLTAARPDLELTMLADSGPATLLAAHPTLHRVLAIRTPPSALLRIPTLKTWYKLYALVRTLLHMDLPHPFDLALVPRGGVDPSFSAHAVWVLNLPQSFGYSHCVEPDDTDHNFGDTLLTQALPTVTELHESMRALALLEAAGLVENVRSRWTEDHPIPSLQQMAVRHSLPMHLDPFGREIPFAVLSPGAGVPKRMWPATKFRRIADLLLEHSPFHVVVVGAKAEEPLCQQIVEGLGPRAQSLAGQLSLPDLITLLSRAALFLGNDSGPGHIAGALGIPTFTLNIQAKGSDPRQISAPEHARPAGPRVTVFQPAHFLPPCQDRCEAPGLHCLDQITVEEVWATLRETFHGIPTQAST